MLRVPRAPIVAALSLVLASPLLAAGTHTARPAGTVPGTGEGFYEYLPDGYDTDPDEEYPILIFLHGVGESGNGSAAHLDRLLGTGLPSIIHQGDWPPTPPGGVQEADRFIVLSLQTACGFPGFGRINAFIDFALGAYRPDAERVYLTGLSAGAISIYGYLADHYLAQLPDKVAAVLPIAGKGTNIVLQNACLYAHIPVWAFHGWTDTVVPPQGSINIINAMNACSPPPTDARLTLFPNVGHVGGVWNRVYDLGRMGTEDPDYDPFDTSVYDWLLRYTRGGSQDQVIFSDGFESGDTSAWSP